MGFGFQVPGFSRVWLSRQAGRPGRSRLPPLLVEVYHALPLAQDLRRNAGQVEQGRGFQRAVADIDKQVHILVDGVVKVLGIENLLLQIGQDQGTAQDRLVDGVQDGLDDFVVSEDGESVQVTSATFYSSRRLVEAPEPLERRIAGIAGRSVLEVEQHRPIGKELVLEREETGAGIAVDGHSIGPIDPADTLRITASGQRVKLVHPPGYDFYEILRSKLLWGRDSRNRAARPG